METEEDTKKLGIKGVYQLQGGIDKYFKHYPEGGLWKGKNYVFDKRFAHAPPAVDAVGQTIKKLADEIGFAGLIVGGIKNARHIEAMAHLNIAIALGGGGTDAGFSYFQRKE